MGAIKKVLSNVEQSLSEKEKATARANIGAVNGVYSLLSAGSGTTTKDIAKITVDVTDTATTNTNLLKVNDDSNQLGSYWLVPYSFSGIPNFAGNGISKYTPPTPNLNVVLNDYKTSYYDVESGTTYSWTFIGGASKNKAIQSITGLDPKKTYLIIYRACLNSTLVEQCVCTNHGDDTYGFSGSDRWFQHVKTTGNTTYPYQHNINYIYAVSGVSSCCVALVGDWSDQPLRSRAQILNHQCQVLCIGG